MILPLFVWGVVGLRNTSVVLSGLGVSLNSLVGLVPTLGLSSSLVDGSTFVGSTVDMIRLPWYTQSAVPSGSVSWMETMSSSLPIIDG